MAGRGRGRGRGGPPMHAGTPLDPARLAALGGAQGLAAALHQQPPPLFPPRATDPQPLDEDQDMEFMVRRCYELSRAMQLGRCFVAVPRPKNELERYTDKYRQGAAPPPNIRSTITGAAWKHYPQELMPADQVRKQKKKERRQKVTAAQRALMSEEQLRELEKREREDEEKEGEKEEEEEGECVEEEEEEEANDYIESYFDDGEGDDMDDGDDEPTF